MADMYGAVCSNWFRVKDPVAFEEWFEKNCYFGDDIELRIEADGRCAFGGYEQYPSAYPRIPPGDDDTYIGEWDVDLFAEAIRPFFADDQQTLTVVSAGHEKLRYVAAQRLRVGMHFCDFAEFSSDI